MAIDDDVGPLAFSYDPLTDVLIINGIRYAGHLFRGLAIAPPGNWVRIVKRANGLVTLFSVPREVSEAFDRFSGYEESQRE
jgi:hypothetical protein